MIICTTVGREPSKLCYEICVLATKCGALKTWDNSSGEYAKLGIIINFCPICGRRIREKEGKRGW